MLGPALYTLHVLGAVLWVGGMAFAFVALRPVLAGLPAPERLVQFEEAMRRFFLIVWHAMPILLATGWALLFGWYGGFKGAGWHIHLMHLTGLVMAAVFLALFLGPFRALRRARAAGDLPTAGTRAASVRRLVVINLALGLFTVAIASWGQSAGRLGE